MERKVNVNIQTHHNDIYYLHTLLNNTALTHTPGSIAESLIGSQHLGSITSMSRARRGDLSGPGKNFTRDSGIRTMNNKKSNDIANVP